MLAASAPLDASPTKLTTSRDGTFECRRATPPCVPELRHPSNVFSSKFYAAFVCGSPVLSYGVLVCGGSLLSFVKPSRKAFPETPETQERLPATLSTSKRVNMKMLLFIRTKSPYNPTKSTCKREGDRIFLLGHVTSTRLLHQRVSILARLKRSNFSGWFSYDPAATCHPSIRKTLVSPVTSRAGAHLSPERRPRRLREQRT